MKRVVPQVARRFFDGWSVPFEPTLTPRVRFDGSPGANLAFPIGHDRVAFTFNGASAIFNAARILGLEAPDNVLCPAYNCGHELEPLLSQGLRVKLFAVGDDLRVDTDDLRRQIDSNTSAVLITHYFGFPQPIDEIRAVCDEHGLWLIEDCAHGFLSEPQGRPLGTVGDVAAFSIRKSLPLPNGGALVVNDPRLRLDQNLRAPPAPATWNKVFDRWLEALRTERVLGSRSAVPSLAALLPLAVARKAVRRLPLWDAHAWYDTDSFDFETDAEVLGWRIADVSLRIVERADPHHVRSRRRHNYRWLVDALGTDVVTPVRRDLPDGVCPLICAVFSDAAVELEGELRARGIEALQWWSPAHPAVNWQEHPREFQLKQRIVALPIHQDLDERQLRMIAEAVRTHH
ncbi:aminotransferase class V-fold PLP-dependent enzyme [Ilumatobacter sp.]|uniref:aminotransferase class V-fold PLP-dependent enzyme n=1 Tax=Ilumatobacter sp. TaxID=1967498 RepID=UPI003AF7405E